MISQIEMAIETLQILAKSDSTAPSAKNLAVLATTNPDMTDFQLILLASLIEDFNTLEQDILTEICTLQRRLQQLEHLVAHGYYLSSVSAGDLEAKILRRGILVNTINAARSTVAV